MTKKNTAAKSVLKVMGFVLLIGGIIFLIISLYLYIDGQSFKENVLQTTAVITKVDIYHNTHMNDRNSLTSARRKNYDVYIEYEVDGVKYEGMLDSYITGMDAGESVTIYYDPADPARIKSEFSTNSMVFIFASIGFILAGIVIALIPTLSERKQKKTVKAGMRAEGVITSVYIDRFTTVNGSNPYKAEVQVTDPRTNEIYLYTSDGYLNDITRLEGCKVPVYFNPDDPSEYSVDIDGAYRDGGTPEAYDFR